MVYISAFESSLNELIKVAEETAESMKENDCMHIWVQKAAGQIFQTCCFLYLGRESNPNLIFRRDLFYPLNYQGEPEKCTDVPFSREDNQNLRKLQML